MVGASVCAEQGSEEGFQTADGKKGACTNVPNGEENAIGDSRNVFVKIERERFLHVTVHVREGLSVW